jgi:hypothetical protein
LTPKKQAFGHPLGDGGAVDRDHLRAAAGGVEGARHRFLPGAALAVNVKHVATLRRPRRRRQRFLQGGPLDAAALDAHTEALDRAHVGEGHEQRIAEAQHAAEPGRLAAPERFAVDDGAVAAVQIGDLEAPLVHHHPRVALRRARILGDVRPAELHPLGGHRHDGRRRRSRRKRAAAARAARLRRPSGSPGSDRWSREAPPLRRL